MFDGCEDWSGGSGRAQEGRGRAGRSAEMTMTFLSFFSLENKIFLQHVGSQDDLDWKIAFKCILFDS